MANTTKEKIVEIAPELSGISDSLFTRIISIVTRLVPSGVWGDCQEDAQSYLAAHFLTEINDIASSGSGAQSGMIEKDKVGDVELQYNSMSGLGDLTRYDSTAYGRTFIMFRKACVIVPMAFTP